MMKKTKVKAKSNRNLPKLRAISPLYPTANRLSAYMQS